MYLDYDFDSDRLSPGQNIDWAFARRSMVDAVHFAARGIYEERVLLMHFSDVVVGKLHTLSKSVPLLSKGLRSLWPRSQSLVP